MAEPQTAWTILELLRWTTEYFRAKGVSEPRASAEVLLAHTLGISRLDLYLRYDQPLNAAELARFKALVVRRRQGEPVAYLTGHREFWSLDFQVTPAVLIPRPETETLVAAAVEVAKDNVGAGLKPAPTGEPEQSLEERGQEQKPPRLETDTKNESSWGLEIGVGSGAVVVALAKELPEINWIGVDISAAALAVAWDNARRHGVLDRVHLFKSDLLSAFKPQPSFDVLVANLPYVPQPEWEQLPRDIKDFEPRQALLAGKDGLDLIRPLVRQAHQYIKAGGWMLLEVGDRQAEKVEGLIQQSGAYDRVESIKDFSGIERVVRARRRDGAG
ncbi:MAG: HemK/PrmC family methyltransferase [Desulfobaccales bacterium]